MGKDKRPLHQFHYRIPLVVIPTANRNFAIRHVAIQADPTPHRSVVDAALIGFPCPDAGPGQFGFLPAIMQYIKQCRIVQPRN